MHRTDEFLEAFLQSDPDPMINGEIPTADGRVQLLDPSCVTTLYGENYGKAFVIDEDCLSAHIQAGDQFHRFQTRTCPTCLWPCVRISMPTELCIECPRCSNQPQYDILHGGDSAGAIPQRTTQDLLALPPLIGRSSSIFPVVAHDEVYSS